MRLPKMVVLLPLLGGCAHYTPGSLDPAAAPAAYAAARLDDPMLRDSVRRYVDDGSITSVRALALAALFTRRDLVASIAEVRAARAAVNVAARGVPLGADAQVERLVYGRSQGAPWLVGLAPVFRIELGGKRAARRLLAAAAVSRAEMETRSMAWGIVMDVRRAGLEHALSQRAIAGIDAAVAAQRRLVEQLQTRRDRGEVGSTEVARVTSELRRLEASAAAAQRVRLESAAALWRAVGLVPVQAIDVDTTVVMACKPEAIALLRADAVRSRYEIGVTLADYAAADAEVRIAVAQGRPDLSFAPGFIFDQGTNRWTLGLGLPEIRLDGNKPAVRAAEARRDAAAAQVAAAQTAVLRELEERVAVCAAGVAERRSAERRVEDAELQAARAHQRFDRGEVGAADTLLAAVAVADARLGVLDAAAREARAALELELSAARWTTGAPPRWPALGMPSDSLLQRP